MRIFYSFDPEKLLRSLLFDRYLCWIGIRCGMINITF